MRLFRPPFKKHTVLRIMLQSICYLFFLAENTVRQEFHAAGNAQSSSARQGASGTIVNVLNDKVAEYFPYATVRPCQDKFISTIFEAVEAHRSVVVEGCNGLGKTVASLSACLPRAMDEKLKILYVARTHRQHDRVMEELKVISSCKPVSGLSVRSRREMCLNSLITRRAMNAREAIEACELLKASGNCSYYRSIDDREDEYSELRDQIIAHLCTASEIHRISRRRGFCPYEVIKSSLADVNVIALSYLYVFDPVIRGAFLKSLETPLSKVLLIIDEAHNLPETAVDIASTSLSLFSIRQAEIEARKYVYDDIAGFVRTFKREVEEMASKIAKETLVPSANLLEFFLEKAGVGEPRRFFEQVRDAGKLIKRDLLARGKYPRSFLYTLGCFLLRWLETVEVESFVDVLTKYVSKQGPPTARLEVAALDPSIITVPVFSQTYCNIVMSGTLQPLNAYVSVTRLPETSIMNVVPSPFPKEHVLSIVSCGVTTAMEKRTPEMYEKIVNRVEEVVNQTPKNTGVFAASFEVLGNLLVGGLRKVTGKPLFCEHRSMSSHENEKMVMEFKAHSKRAGAVLLGVQGGRSSEGVDFPGDEMNSVVIVGVPYAEPTPKVRAQISYFEKCFPGHGRDYCYVLPAMKKASQAAGRPIRSLEDRAALVFLDYRFAAGQCRTCLPSWIRDNLRVFPDEDGAIGRELSLFFSKPC
jgi:DNA excision repair protein ERCC-2